MGTMIGINCITIAKRKALQKVTNEEYNPKKQAKYGVYTNILGTHYTYMKTYNDKIYK